MDTCYQKIQRPSERNLLTDGSSINCTGKRLTLVNCHPSTDSTINYLLTLKQKQNAKQNR